jgi:hypothetical protein
MLTTPSILWGSLGPDSHAIDTALEQAVGKTQSLVHLAQAWAYGRAADGTPNYAPFPAAMLQPSYARGSLVLLDWASWDITKKDDPAFGLDAIVAGQHDPFIHTWAAAAASFARPLMLRFDWEFNGGWFPYGAQPAKFVATWKKVRAIFAAEGATNVSWLWCANVCAPAGAPYSSATDKLAAYYPGDDQVDWTGLDTYNWSTGNAGPWMTFGQTMNGYPGWLGATYDTLAKLAPSKPIAIGEFGCWDDPRKPMWLVDALGRIPTDFPLVRAISYFNWPADGATWPLSGDALSAFKAAIASPVYLPAATFTPADRLPFGAPPLNLTLTSPVPADYKQRGWTSWEQVAAGLAASVSSATANAAALTTQVQQLQQRAQSAEADIAAVRASLQTLTQVAGQAR